MKKTSQAFQLDSMIEPVTLFRNPKDKKWYPKTHFYECNKNQIFIYGQGWVKVDKWKQVTIDPLTNPFTAEQLKTVADEYGLNAAMGMIKGWSSSSLFDDNSIGLDVVKYEVANMTTFGKVYDIYSNHVQKVGDAWVKGLLDNGFTMDGTIENGWLWHNYKNENDCGELLGKCGIYGKVKLHPLQHVNHNIGYGRVPPMFNPISFDKLLETLFRAIYLKPDNDYSKVDAMLKKIESVEDRIKHLTTKEIAEGIASIFEAQKELDIARAA